MSSTTLLGEKDRKFKSAIDNRILPVSSKVYKLKDRGEGTVRLTITAPIEALNDFAAALEFLESRLDTPIPVLNAARVATQKARERCAASRYEPRNAVVEHDNRRLTLQSNN